MKKLATISFKYIQLINFYWNNRLVTFIIREMIFIILMISFYYKKSFKVWRTQFRFQLESKLIQMILLKITRWIPVNWEKYSKRFHSISLRFQGEAMKASFKLLEDRKMINISIGKKYIKLKIYLRIDS